MDPDIPPLAQKVATAYLELLDAEAPGLLIGLYLIGSVALNDFRPGRSDVDFVAVTDVPIDPAEHLALHRVHERLRASVPGTSFEGVYLTRNDLARDPAACPPVPFARGGLFQPTGRFEISPITWVTLARHGRVVRGPSPDALATIWDDPAALDAWVRQNLATYWRAWRSRLGRLASRDGLAAFRPSTTEWSILGVSRLHYTLVSGEIISKYGAGLYAMRRMSPRWQRIVVEALMIRRADGGHSVYRTPLGRRRDMLAFVEMAIEEALNLPSRLR